MTLEKKDLIHSDTRCTARRKNGEPCRNWAMLGTTVCRMHGGAAPQVRRAAQVRLAMAADPAAARLIEIANDKRMPPAVRLAANKEILDRANVVGTQQLHVGVEVSTFDQNTDDLIVVQYVSDPNGEVVDAEVVEDEADLLARHAARIRERDMEAGQDNAPSASAPTELRPAQRPKPATAAVPGAADELDDNGPFVASTVQPVPDAEYRRQSLQRAKQTPATGKLRPRRRRA